MPIVNLTINHQVPFGKAIYVIFDFDQWDLKYAKRMTFLKDSYWSLYNKVESTAFEYKYLIADYDNLESAHILWEEGPNRQCQLGDWQKLKKIQDRWGTRQVTLSLQGLANREALVVLYGSCKQLASPQMMRMSVSKGIYTYKLRVYIELDEINRELEFQYYVALFIGKAMKEFVSKSFCLQIGKQHIKEIKQIELTRLQQ